MSTSRALNPSNLLVAVFVAAILVPTAAHSLPLGQADAYVSLNTDFKVATIDASTLGVAASIFVSQPRGLAVSTDGNTLYAISGSATVQIITAAADTPCFFNGDVEQVAVTPDGSKLVVPSHEAVLANQKVWFINTSNCVADRKFIGGDPFGVAIVDTGAGVFAYVTHRTANHVTVWNTVTHSQVGTINVGLTPQGITTSPSGDRVYVANSGDGSISVIDPAANTVVKTLTGIGGALQELTVNAAGKLVFATRKDAGTVAVVDTNSGAVIRNVTFEVGTGEVYGISFSADGTSVIVAHPGTDKVSVIDPTGVNPPSTFGIAGGIGGTRPFYVAAKPLVPDDPPQFDPGLMCGMTLTPAVGEQVIFPIIASDDNEVTLDVAGLPTGASMDPVLPVTNSPSVTSGFSWTAAAGTHVVTFTASDAVGSLATCVVTIEPEPSAPSDDLPTWDADTLMACSSGPIVAPVGVAMMLTIGASDPGDVLTLSVSGAPPGAMFSAALDTPTADAVSTTMTWTPTLADVTTHSTEWFVQDAGEQNALPSPCLISIEVPPVSFGSFDLRFAKVSTRGRFADSFFFYGRFTVDTTDGNIDLKTDSVVITIESQTFEIPPNAFKGRRRGRLFRFKGIVDGAKLLVHITRRGRHGNRYNITVGGWKADLDAKGPLLEMCLQIGNNLGCDEKKGRIR